MPKYIAVAEDHYYDERVCFTGDSVQDLYNQITCFDEYEWDRFTIHELGPELKIEVKVEVVERVVASVKKGSKNA